MAKYFNKFFRIKFMPRYIMFGLSAWVEIIYDLQIYKLRLNLTWNEFETSLFGFTELFVRDGVYLYMIHLYPHVERIDNQISNESITLW